MKTAVWCRKPVVVNTDPQRRCYDSCNFSERTEWGPWVLIAVYPDKAAAQSSADTFKSINPTWDYKLEPSQ